MSKKKYIVIGGNVKGEYISPYYVAAMNKVNLDECLFFVNEFAWNKYKARFGHLETLRPDEEGKYERGEE